MTYSSFPGRDPGEEKRDEETLNRARDEWEDLDLQETLRNVEENKRYIDWEVDGNDLSDVDPYEDDKDWPEDTDVSDINLFGTALKGLQKVGEGLDWIDKQAGIGDFNVYNARQTVIQPLSDVHVALGILGEFLIPDTLDITTFGAGYIPRRFAKAPKMWAKAVLAMKRADIPTVRAQALQMANTPFTEKVYAIGASRSSRKATKETPKIPFNILKHFHNNTNEAKKFTANSPETFERLDNFVWEAINHMKANIAVGRKRSLLKKWKGPKYKLLNGQEDYLPDGWIFKDDAGTQWIYTRAKGSRMPDYSKIASDYHLATALTAAYSLRPLDTVLLDIAKNSNWPIRSKNLDEIKKAFNKSIDYWNNTDKIIGKHILMDYGTRGAYLEHKVRRANWWFWPQKVYDPWKGEEVLLGSHKSQHLTDAQRKLHGITGGNRNDPSNIRLLYNERYKKLKDRVETLIAQLWNDLPGMKVFDKIVVSIEDPFTIQAKKGLKGTQKMTELKFRNLPGNITLRRAGDAKLIGKIGDFLDGLYSPGFKDMVKEKKFTGMGYGDELESSTEYITRQLTDRIEAILKNKDELLDMDDIAAEQRVLARVEQDLADFYDMHPWVDRQAGLQKHYRDEMAAFGDVEYDEYFEFMDDLDDSIDWDDWQDLNKMTPETHSPFLRESLSTAERRQLYENLTQEEKTLIDKGKAVLEDFIYKDIEVNPARSALRTTRASRQVK